jgi:hypothetical protein
VVTKGMVIGWLAAAFIAYLVAAAECQRRDERLFRKLTLEVDRRDQSLLDKTAALLTDIMNLNQSEVIQ